MNTDCEKQRASALSVSVAILAFITVAVFGDVFPFAGHLAFEPAAAVLATTVVVVQAFSAEITGIKVSYIN